MVDLLGEGKVTVGKDTVAVQGTSSVSYSLSVRDITWLRSVDYRIELGTSSGSLMLFDLGYRFEDVLRAVHAARNKLLITDSLVYESPKMHGIQRDRKGQGKGGRYRCSTVRPRAAAVRDGAGGTSPNVVRWCE